MPTSNARGIVTRPGFSRGKGASARPRTLTWIVGEGKMRRSARLLMDAGIVRHRGKITAHAFLQAMRLVNDHIEGFATRKSVERARSVFQKPGRRPGQPV